MVKDPNDLEIRFRWLASGMVAAFGLALGAGLVLYVWRPDSLPASVLLQTGLVLLMLAPPVRLLLAVAERLRRRDWAFVTMTLVVVIELGIVMWRAAQKL